MWSRTSHLEMDKKRRVKKTVGEELSEDEEGIKTEQVLEKAGAKCKTEGQLRSRAKQGVNFGREEVTSDT